MLQMRLNIARSSFAMGNKVYYLVGFAFHSGRSSPTHSFDGHVLEPLSGEQLKKPRVAQVSSDMKLSVINI